MKWGALGPGSQRCDSRWALAQGQRAWTPSRMQGAGGWQDWVWTGWKRWGVKSPGFSQAPRGSGVEEGMGRLVSGGQDQLQTLSLGCLGKRRGLWASGRTTQTLGNCPWCAGSPLVPVTAGDSACSTCTMTFHAQGN